MVDCSRPTVQELPCTRLWEVGVAGKFVEGVHLSRHYVDHVRGFQKDYHSSDWKCCCTDMQILFTNCRLRKRHHPHRRGCWFDGAGDSPHGWPTHLGRKPISGSVEQGVDAELRGSAPHHVRCVAKEFVAALVVAHALANNQGVHFAHGSLSTVEAL